MRIASGAGSCASAASACMCRWMIGSRFCAAVGSREGQGLQTAARPLMAAEYTPSRGHTSQAAALDCRQDCESRRLGMVRIGGNSR